MLPASSIAPPRAAADAGPAITLRGRLPWYAALIPRKAMGSWVEEWEDGNEPEGWVARRMADAFDRMIRLAQASGEGVEELRRNLSDARRRQAAAADTRTTIAGHPRPASDASASPVALVATRPSHGPPALPA